MVDPIPAGFHTVSPYLSVRGMDRCFDFCRASFDVDVLERLEAEDGSPRHVQLKIGDSLVMMGECPESHDPMPAMLYVYLPDVDATYSRAVSAGGEVVEAPANQAYGDRTAAVRDPCGNVWYLATHVEDVSPEEIQRRMAEG